ncbi:MAG: flagellar export protein FliJ [Ruminiclostridium sp.]|nr:flagellar export protein FliJ [Ruminiclostridium sp.]
MKKFEFTLERLKQYREQTLETEKGTLAQLRGERNRLQAELEGILEELARLNRELTELYAKGTTPLEISVHKRYISAKQQELHMKRHQILMKEREIERQLEAVVQATQEVSKLDKLEEHQLEEYRAAEQKETELFIEEFVSNSDWRKAHAENVSL